MISVFKIVSETGIAAGVRRIEALTGDGVFAYYQELEDRLNRASALLKTTPAELENKIAHLQGEVKALHSENEALKSKLAKGCSGRCYGSGTGDQRRENFSQQNWLTWI